ncbi:MAG: hypothetical protein ACJ76F_01170 [Bacteroidia bacterium]
MRKFIFILFALAALFSKAQCGSRANSLDLYYGSRSFTGSFYDQFNKVNKLNFSAPLQVMGVGVSGRFIVSRDGGFSGHFTFAKVVPQSIRLQDTLNCKVSGFIFSYGYGTSVLRIRRLFELDAYAGFNTGRIKCYGNELVRQKNPFFSPKIGLQPKLNIHNMAISLRFEYEYDVSGSNWRRTLVASDKKVNLEKFRQTGFTALLGIGYIF